MTHDFKKFYEEASLIRSQWLNQYDFIANLFFQVSGQEQKQLLKMGFPNVKKLKNYSSFGVNLVENLKKNYGNMLFPQKSDLFMVDLKNIRKKQKDEKPIQLSLLRTKINQFKNESNFQEFIDYFLRDFLLGNVCYGLDFKASNFYVVPFSNYCFLRDYTGQITHIFVEKKLSEDQEIVECYAKTKEDGKSWLYLNVDKNNFTYAEKDIKKVYFCPYNIVSYYPLNNENYGRGILFQINEDYQRYNLIQKQISKLIRILTPKYLATSNSNFDYSSLLDDDVIPVDSNQTTAPTLSILQIDIGGLNGLLAERNLLGQKIQETCNIFLNQQTQTATASNQYLDNLNGNILYKIGNIQNKIAQDLGLLILCLLSDNDEFLNEEKEEIVEIEQIFSSLKITLNNYLTNTFDLNLPSVVSTIQTIALFDPELSFLSKEAIEKLIIEKNIGQKYILGDKNV